MRVLLFLECFLFLIIDKSLGQTIIKDCSAGQFVADVVVYDAENNTIVGISNADGIVEIDPKVLDLSLVHPDYGTIKTTRHEVICIDQLLNTIVIDLHFDAKKELLGILENTYDLYRIDPYEEQVFSYIGKIYENNNEGELLIQEKGGFNKNSTFYDTSFFMSDRLVDFFDNMSLVAFHPLIADDKIYFFFNSEKHFKRLIKKVKASEVNKINSDYFVYDITGINYWQFEIDPIEKRVIRFVNSKEVLLSSDNRWQSPIVQRLIEVRYSLVGTKLEQRLDLFELYKSTRSGQAMAKNLTIKTVNLADEPFGTINSLSEYSKLKRYKRRQVIELADRKKE
ncbi:MULTISPECIES: hypothetical protein [unclassified Myroides]|uniref:hypothetical protein n=1 Tax=unclassified Myroides TaxID=2642485 RepID=UPI0015FD9F50|nr:MULTISPECIES: hypothetical protein [unclassified Myroides]MBB1149123.1 hypothetical protein [Myroides sp. NP-2]MDM1406117.1 hypothetical protein [Myroides sp. DF42-4-2]